MKRKFRLPLRGREWLLFATSLIIAVLIWFLSNLSRSYSGVLGVPVIAECNIQGYSNLSSNSAMLSARCRAEGFRLLREGTRRSRRPIQVSFDRADLRHGTGDRFFVTGNVMNNYLRQIFGDKVDVEDIITDTLYFLFPQENNKRVPVNFTGDFTYRSQYMASGPLKITPDSVTVYGEKARLDLVDHVSTAQVFPDPVSRYVELRSELPVSVRNAPGGHHLDVFPSRATVVLHCIFPVGRDPFESFELFIDYEDFASSLSGRCVPRVRELPRGVLDYRVEPAVFDCIETD